MNPRTIAIGDIHGCSAALDALLEAFQPSSEDTIVTLGDYINRGPDSRGVIDKLIELKDRCRLVPLRGNHEEMCASAEPRPPGRQGASRRPKGSGSDSRGRRVAEL